MRKRAKEMEKERGSGERKIEIERWRKMYGTERCRKRKTRKYDRAREMKKRDMKKRVR